jgi:hypothetical protein
MSRGDPSSLRSARPVLGDAEPGVDVTLSATELKFWLIKHLGVHDCAPPPLRRFVLRVGGLRADVSLMIRSRTSGVGR